MSDITKVTKKDGKKTITFEVEQISNGWILTKVTRIDKDTGPEFETIKRFYQDNPLSETVTERKIITSALDVY